MNASGGTERIGVWGELGTACSTALDNRMREPLRYQLYKRQKRIQPNAAHYTEI